MGKSIYEMKESVANLGGEVKGLASWLGEKADDPSTSMEEIRAKQARMEEMQARLGIAQAALATEEASQREAVKRQGAAPEGDAKAESAKHLAGFLRALKSGNRAQANGFMAKLGAIPEGDAALGGGENLLPTNMVNELIHEPFETNPMREVVSMSQITGLELPRIAYELDDDDFVTDKDVANEMKLKGDKQSFGRFKYKVKVRISDTVMYGSDLDLQSYVSNALQSGMAAKEKRLMFAEAPATDLAHMSIYAPVNAVKVIAAESGMLDGILEAYGDLNDQFAERATVAMRRIDYVTMIREMANTSDTLWGKKPEDVIGVPVHFCDQAKKPVVGSMRNWRINYDIPPTYDTDKDVESGDFIFVLTCWVDIQLLLASAFRVVSVTP